MKNSSDLGGVITALLTPFDKNGVINENELIRLIEYNLHMGIDTFYVGGSTAEMLLLTIKERESLFEIAGAALKGRGRFIAHVGALPTADAVHMAAAAEQSGAAAISAVPPYYYNFSFDEIYSYYVDIVKSSSLPMIVYHVPGFSGVSMSRNDIVRLAGIEGVGGIKYTDGNLFMLERIRADCLDLKIFSGQDTLFAAAALTGADGAIGSTFNVYGDRYIEIKNRLAAGDIEGARLLQRRVNNITEMLEKVGVIPGEKYLLGLLGIDVGECRAPFKNLSDEEKQLIRSTAEANGLAF